MRVCVLTALVSLQCDVLDGNSSSLTRAHGLQHHLTHRHTLVKPLSLFTDTVQIPTQVCVCV